MKTAIIIGANSYIARNLIYHLNQKEEIKLVGFYDYTDTQADDANPYQKINIKSKESVASINMDCDVIYMFVGKTGSTNGFTDYQTFIDINEISLLNVLSEYLNQKSKAKIIFPSTRLVYKGQDYPLKEDAEKEFKTIYAMNKYSCENYLKQYHEVYGVNYCILRICVPYGTMIKDASSYGTAEFMLNKAAKGEDIVLFGDGLQKRTLIDMIDLCETLYKVALSENCINDVFNVGGEEYSIRSMAELLAQKYKVKVSYIEWPEIALKVESGSTVFDDEKLRNRIGNVITHSFSDWVDGEIFN